MGTIYSVCCKTCKVTRDLDKFWAARVVEDREDALAYRKEIEKESFRAGLLVSFMEEHRGHECVFLNEHNACSEELDPTGDQDCDYREDTDFWIDAE